MKKSHIFGIVVIAIAVMIIASTVGDASSYVTFKEAKELSQGGDKKMIHVVGQLKKDAAGHVVGIMESPDKLSFSFVMVDNDGQEQKVLHNKPMPQDFMRSEQVVIIGKYGRKNFIADQILLKCPSKYEEQKVK
ncbi:MAG: cytochrome c maturation protein CcmE [Cytophagales bacterium]|nr:cytochrome c maturation protein CcmE [Cytophagales bacterium]